MTRAAKKAMRKRIGIRIQIRHLEFRVSYERPERRRDLETKISRLKAELLELFA